MPDKSITRSRTPSPTMSRIVSRNSGSVAATMVSPDGCTTALLSSLVTCVTTVPFIEVFDHRHQVASIVEANPVGVAVQDFQAPAGAVQSVGRFGARGAPVEAFALVRDGNQQAFPPQPQRAANLLPRVGATAVHYSVGQRFANQQFGLEAVYTFQHVLAVQVEFLEKLFDRLDGGGERLVHLAIESPGVSHRPTSAASSSRSSSTDSPATCF